MKHYFPRFNIFDVLQQHRENTIYENLCQWELLDKFKHIYIYGKNEKENSNTKFKVTKMEENAKESKGMSSNSKRQHSDDSGPGENWGFFSFAKKIT